MRRHHRGRKAAWVPTERELEFQLTEESWGRIRALADALLNVIMLDELREARRMTHTKLMDTLQIGRSEVSRIEYRTDLYINALDTYLKDQDALLEIWRSFLTAELESTGSRTSPSARHLSPKPV